MKLIALATLALLVPKADVRFEGAGVRVGDALVQGSLLELKGSATGMLLASGSSIEALTASLDIQLAPERVLTLDPGLRVTRVDGGFLVTAHQPRRIRLSGSGEAIFAASPALVAVTAEGWTVGDRSFEGSALRARLEGQDEESNLDKMMQAKDRMRPPGVPKLASRSHRLYRGDPLTAGQAANSISVRQITQVTPSGSP